MNILASLKRRARFLAAGLLSFLAVVAALRWSEGEPLFQPSADLGLILGFVFIAGYFVVKDAARASHGGAP